VYQVGDLIFYGGHGVYQVADIAPLQHIKCCDPNQPYYKLSAVQGSDVIYAPVDSTGAMRPLISPQEAEALLAQPPAPAGKAFLSNDTKLLHAHYRQIMETHSCQQLMGLIQSVNVKKQLLAKSKKHLSLTDQEFKKRAETLLCEELSVVLNLPRQEIQQRLNLLCAPRAEELRVSCPQ
jgi:CarD family transcriptional regulator